MVLFDFKLENHFVGSSDGTSLQVYELTRSSADFSSIHKADWKKVATINPQPDDDGHACDGLRFFDNGDERIEELEVLRMLALHLKQLRLLASPEGYCCQQVSEFGVHYLRLNDLFSWPRYGVKLVTVNTTWSRLELKLLKDEDDNELEMKTEVQKSTKSRNINVLIVLLGELQRRLKKKDERIEELEKVNDDLEDTNETKDEELQKLQRELKRKDDQVEMLKKKLNAEVEASDTRIAELEKQKEDSDEANRAKDKELQKQQRQLKTKSQRIEELEKMNEELEEAKDENEVSKLKKLLKVKDKELQVLRKKKEDDEAEASKLKNEVVKLRKEKDDEVFKTRKVEGELKEVREKLSSSVAEVAKVKKELEECQRKKDEAAKIRKVEEELKQVREKLTSSVAEVAEVKKKLEECQEKKDEAAKTREVEAELKEVREKLSDSVAEMAKMKKELEECGRKLWVILSTTKYLPQSLDAKDMYLSIRQPVPTTAFNCIRPHQSSYAVNWHQLVDKMVADGEYKVRLVDDESSPSEWPPLPKIDVWVSRANDEVDKNNWWYLKTTHPEGGLTMLVYYEGTWSNISGSSSDLIPLPFYPGILEAYSFTHRFSLFRIDPFGVRFGFMYRPK